MAVHMSKNMRTAKKAAKKYRMKGYMASAYKAKKGARVSVTRK